jgi:ABC-type multidrug transport system fused ATPase/permease subunit
MEEQSMKDLKRLLGLLKPYIGSTLVAILLMLSFTAMDYIMPLILKQTIDVGIPTKNMEYITQLILIMLALVVMRSAFLYFQGFFMERTGQKVAYDLRNRLYAHMQNLSFSFFDKQHTGQIMSRMTGDIDCIRVFLGFAFIHLFVCVINFTFTMGIFIWFSWKLALLVLMPTPVLVVVVVIFSKKIEPAWKEVREQMGKLTSVLQENITGIRAVKAFAREPHEKGKFDGRNVQNFKENMRRAGIEANAFPFMDFLGGLTFILLAFFGGFFVVSGEITLGDYTALQWYAFGLIWPIRFCGWLINLMQQAIAASPRVFEILDTKPEVEEKAGAVQISRGNGHVVLENINHNFSDGQSALKNINLNVHPGEIVAVIGGTGSGKSTLIGLMPRFFDPTEGRVLLDGKDLKEIALKNLRSSIGIVMQETFLFSDTIRENIAYGRPDATQEEIEQVAQIAHIHDFIAGLPEGYNTRVGERGMGLSGGQKQRIAIARALLIDPAVLVLDEATASVDTATERAIQASLHEIMKGRTTFIIAQRLSTIKNAHRIVVMENGEIVEVGRHEELIAKEGFYSRIYDLQFKDQEMLEIA